MPRVLDPTTLRYFIAICEEGNIAQAAEREAIVASAISKRILALEEDLGVTLFVRDRRCVKPTAAGEVLLRQARDILSLMDRTRAELSEFTKGVHGSVRVLAGFSALIEFLPDDISEFLAGHQSVRVALEEQVSVDIVRAVHEGSADFGICWDAVELEGLQRVSYKSDRLCLVTPADHPLAKLDAIHFADSLEYDHIRVIKGSLTDIMLQREARQHDRQIPYRVQVSTFDAACRMVASKLGITVLPRQALQQPLQDPRIKAIDLLDPWAARQFVICFRSADGLTNAAKLLVKHLSDSASQQTVHD
mgnify:CR=1 FL=1